VRDGEEAVAPQDAQDSLLDLISDYGNQAEAQGKAAGKKEEAKSSGKAKGGQK
jgi:hypothetical protein